MICFSYIRVPPNCAYMSQSLNSFKADYIGATIGFMKGDTWSLDYGAYVGICMR